MADSSKMDDYFGPSKASEARTEPTHEQLPDSALQPEEHPCYAVLPEQRANSLDLVFLDGKRRALGYAYLTEVRFDPSVGIEVHFVSSVVKVTGRNLHPLYDALRTQRAYRVAEVDSRYGLNEAETAVTRIEVVESAEQPAAP